MEGLDTVEVVTESLPLLLKDVCVGRQRIAALQAESKDSQSKLASSDFALKDALVSVRADAVQVVASA